MTLIEFKASSTAQQLEAGAATPRPTNLKARLVFVDGVALSGGFALSAFVLGAPNQAQRWEHLFWILFATMVGLVVLRCQGLFLARVSAVRAVELTRVTYSSGIPIGSTVTVTARALLNGVWSALVQATFHRDLSALKITVRPSGEIAMASMAHKTVGPIRLAGLVPSAFAAKRLFR